MPTRIMSYEQNYNMKRNSQRLNLRDAAQSTKQHVSCRF